MSNDLGFERIIKEKEKFWSIDLEPEYILRIRFSSKDLGFERIIKEKEKF